jgi:hypothetical protein
MLAQHLAGLRYAEAHPGAELPELRQGEDASRRLFKEPADDWAVDRIDLFPHEGPAELEEEQIKALRRKARQLGLEIVEKTAGSVATAAAAPGQG